VHDRKGAKAYGPDRKGAEWQKAKAKTAIPEGQQDH